MDLAFYRSVSSSGRTAICLFLLWVCCFCLEMHQFSYQLRALHLKPNAYRGRAEDEFEMVLFVGNSARNDHTYRQMNSADKTMVANGTIITKHERKWPVMHYMRFMSALDVQCLCEIVLQSTVLVIQ